MQSVQRKFGKVRTADESQVAVLLKDFEDADKMLSRIIEASKAWRDAWTDILTVQQRLAYDFQDLYSPIVESNETYEGRGANETPKPILMRTVKLQQAYADLKTDLLGEINGVDTRIIRPAMDARDHIHPLKKVIKKRMDKKMDFEKYQSRVDKGRKNMKRSDKDNAALAKAETELFHATEEYNAADDHLRSRLPPLITAAFSLLPNLLAAQIMTQNSLLAQCYTVLHEYCGEARFPSPPPPMNEIISCWDQDFRPIQKEVETGIACIANGKVIRQPMKLGDTNGGKKNKQSIISAQTTRRYHCIVSAFIARPEYHQTQDLLPPFTATLTGSILTKTTHLIHPLPNLALARNTKLHPLLLKRAQSLTSRPIRQLRPRGPAPGLLLPRPPTLLLIDGVHRSEQKEAAPAAPAEEVAGGVGRGAV
ncbi:MAG: hypothetical protein Q9203_005554 [Teloschistes exilis]